MKKMNIFLIAAALLIVAAVVYWWLRTAETPKEQEQLAPMPETEFAQNPALGTLPGEGEPSVMNLNADTLRNFLDQLAQPKNLYWHTKYEIHSGDTIQYSYASYTRVGTRQKVEQRSVSGKLEMTYTLTPSKVTIADARTGDKSTLALSHYSYVTLLHMPELSYFYGTADENISAVRLEKINGLTALYVEFYFPEIKQTEKYWLSSEYGVPLLAESYLDGKLTLRTSTLDINDTGASLGG